MTNFLEAKKFQNSKSLRRHCNREALTKGYLLEFVQYIKYAQSLEFEEKPDYSYRKKLFRSLMILEGLEYDLLFDWAL